MGIGESGCKTYEREMITSSSIESVTLTSFTTTSRTFNDSEGHGHPTETERPATGALLTIRDSNGAEGYCFADADHLRPRVLTTYVRPALIGQDPLRREAIWNSLYRAQRGSYGGLHNRTLSYIDQALWDLAGRKLGQPAWKLAGGYRTSIPAYASTMCGDDIPGGLSSPEDYAAFAQSLVKQGYKGIKLHTWMPPVSFAPDARMDVKACAAVREAVGPDITLMVDSHHYYSRSDALYIGTELAKLDFAWMEEPMDEYSMASYKWLTDRIHLPIAGPESVEGTFRSRADWAAAGAVDILRIGVNSAGGIGSAIKTCHLAEAFGMDCEIHGGGAGTLALFGAAPNSRWYERGLLHPHLDFDTPPPHLRAVIDPIDLDGLVHLPDGPGLGEDINFEYIAQNQVSVA